MTNMNAERGTYDMYPTEERWTGVGFPAEHGGLGHDGHEGFEVVEPTTEEGRQHVQAMLDNYFSSSRSGVEVSTGQ